MLKMFFNFFVSNDSNWMRFITSAPTCIFDLGYSVGLGLSSFDSSDRYSVFLLFVQMPTTSLIKLIASESSFFILRPTTVLLSDFRVSGYPGEPVPAWENVALSAKWKVHIWWWLRECSSTSRLYTRTLKSGCHGFQRYIFRTWRLPAGN